jgi:transcription antitermination factor NusG
MPFYFVKEQVRPLFPGYLFVQFDNTKPWRSICYTDGVQSVLGSPSPLPDNLVQGLIDACLVKDGAAVLYPDVKIYIDLAPFENEAIVDWASPTRVRLLLSCLGRRVKCMFTKQEIEDIL